MGNTCWNRALQPINHVSEHADTIKYDVYLKKSEPISLTGEAGEIPPEPSSRPPRPEAESKMQTAKEPEKISTRTLL